MEDNLRRIPGRPHMHMVANIRVREAFHRLRQFGHDHQFLDVGLVLQEDLNVPQNQNPRQEVDIQLRVVREDGDNPQPIPTRTPKVPKTELISGAIPAGTFCNVMVTKVISPAMFWITPIASMEELKILERQMAVFYEDEHSPFRDPNFFIEEGAYSGGYYAFYSRSQRCWVRAICGYDAVLVTRNTSVSMYLLDHGKVEHVPATSIRPLQSSFCKLPAQGLMAAFVGEARENEPNRWSPETCLAFRSQLIGKKLQVAVIKKCSSEFPSRFTRAEVVLKESPSSSSVITAWSPAEGRFIKTPQLSFSIPTR
ncbi:Tudor domain-containing protein 7B [Orchesella cincta]|uniref:Tudor domain-containing protein 7B n=1 Tax=Orchesella cincta TaxID=48709 RepID=A0A1D2NHF9_ORCCI|nr:Tudor domain-containing protein 7B [Orchesella cincta]